MVMPVIPIYEFLRFLDDGSSSIEEEGYYQCQCYCTCMCRLLEEHSNDACNNWAEIEVMDRYI